MKTNNTDIHPTLQAKVDDFMQNATPESILADCETMEIKTQPIEGISYQFRNKGQTFWREMDDKDDWGFVAQFLPNYERRDDVAFSDDLECVIGGGHEYKDLEWLQATYTEYANCSIGDICHVQEEWDKELFQEAEKHLRHLVQLGSIEVREFPTSIVSARILGNGDGNDDCVVLQCADANSYMFGQQFKVPSSKLQNVRTRDLPDYDPEVNDDWQIQIYYEGSGGSYWCNAINIDFE